VKNLVLIMVATLTLHGAANAAPLSPVKPTQEHRLTAHQLAHAVQGRVVAVANTGSMEPAISAKDLLVVKPFGTNDLSANDITVGDVVVFRTPTSALQYAHVGLLTCHRMIGRKGNYIHTKGDNRVKADAPVRFSKVQGVVLYAIDGQTGVIRDMRASRIGEPISLEQAFTRHGLSAVSASLGQKTF
jgi:hypothetical protein